MTKRISSLVVAYLVLAVATAPGARAGNAASKSAPKGQAAQKKAADPAAKAMSTTSVEGGTVTIDGPAPAVEPRSRLEAGGERARISLSGHPPNRLTVALDGDHGEHYEVQFEPGGSNELTRMLYVGPGAFNVTVAMQPLSLRDASDSRGQLLITSRFVAQETKGQAEWRAQYWALGEQLRSAGSGSSTEPRWSELAGPEFTVRIERLRLPSWDESVASLVTSDGGAVAGRAFEDAAARVVNDLFLVLGEIAAERAMNNGFQFVSERLTTFVCDELKVGTLKAVLEESTKAGARLGKLPTLLVLDSRGEDQPLLPRTCQAVRSLRLQELASSGKTITAALSEDLLSVSSRLAIYKAFEDLAPAEREFIEESLVATLAFVADGIRHPQRMRGTDAQLLLTDLAYRSTKLSGPGSPVICGLQTALAAVAICQGREVCDARALKDVLINPTKYFAEVGERCAELPVVHLANRIASTLAEVKGVDVKSLQAAASAALAALDTAEDDAEQQALKARLEAMVALDPERVEEDLNAFLTALEKAEIALRAVGVTLSARPISADAVNGALVEARSKADALAKSATALLPYSVLLTKEADWSALASDARLGLANSKLTDATEFARRVVTTVDDAWPGIERFALTVLELANPPPGSTPLDQGRRVVSVSFELAERLIDSTDRADSSARIRRLHALRRVAESSLERDALNATLAAIDLLHERYGECAENTDTVRYLTRTSRLVSTLTAYLETYKVESKADAEAAKQQHEARKQAIVSLIDASTDRSSRHGEWIVSLGTNVGLDVGLHSKALNRVEFLPPQLALPLGVAVQRLPEERGYLGWHFMLSAVDLGQYVSYDTNFNTTLNTQGAWKTALSFGGQVALVLGTPTHPFTLGIDARFAPGLAYGGEKIGNLRAGVFASYFVPFFDFN